MALSKIQAESMNLADTFAFSGTVSGAGDPSYFVKLAHTNVSDNTASIIYDNVISSTYDNYVLIGSVVTTSTSNCQMQLIARTGGASGSDVSSGWALGQGEWANRQSGSAYQGYVRANVANNIVIPSGLSIYGGAVFTWRCEMMNFHTGLVSEATNVTARRKYQGNYSWTAQATNALDNHGGSGWFQADTAGTGTAPIITGIKLLFTAGQFNLGSISLFGYAK